MSTVYVVMGGVEAGRGYVEGAYATPESAMRAYPNDKWHSRVYNGVTSWWSSRHDIEPYEVQS